MFRCTQYLLIALALATFSVFLNAQTLAQDTAQADARLATRFQQWLDDQCKRHPMFATYLGNHDYDHELDDLSPQARAEDLQNDKKVLAELQQQVDLKSLSRNAQIDLEIWQHFLEYRIWQATNSNDFANDPRVYLTYASDSVFTLLTQSTLPQTHRWSHRILRKRHL